MARWLSRPFLAWSFAVSFAACAFAQTSGPSGLGESIRLIHVAEPADIHQARLAYPAEPPALRGFEAPILGVSPSLQPFALNNGSAPPEFRQAGIKVARQLATDGLLSTLAGLISLLGPQSFVAPGEEQIAMLRGVGFPVDWLTYFQPAGAADNDPSAIIRFIAQKAAAGMTPDALSAELKRIEFRFRKTREGFVLASEEGSNPIKLLRLQMPSASYWKGPGDGSALDVVSQCVRTWPDADFLITTRAELQDQCLSQIKSWPLKRPAQLSLIVTDWNVGQWAHDNGKPGVYQSRGATLLPRYASRGEERTSFDPAESFGIEALKNADHTLIHSPLIFQGGNLMAVSDPQAKQRILLIGEAEVARNIALGLTQDQVLEAFRIECGVDRCIVIPAISFHLDFELTTRAHEGGIIAFVNDEMEAARITLGLAVDAAEKANRIDRQKAQSARAHLKAGEIEKAIELMAAPLAGGVNKNGQFPLSFANMFGSGGVDSPAANLQRVMLAVDILACSRLDPAKPPADQFLAAYVRSLHRRTKDREALRQILAGLGWKVVPIPSTAEENRSINYLNGLQEPGRYVMPVYGGFFSPLDDAAAKAFRDALGPTVRIETLNCGESQRRLGALHCSASAYPAGN